VELVVRIERISAIEEYRAGLSNLLVEVVEGGASIGFLPPMGQSAADQYWEQVPGDNVILFIAKIDHQMVGTVQLHLCTKENGSHRAEIAKLMTHPGFQRKGIGRLLMQEAEKAAKENGRTLLVLDTREGDVSNLLYTSMGYSQAGRIPNFAQSEKGTLDATILYYKLL
jgi:ribosomal protein S18 acetylase RimI-like enzyme